VNQPSTKLGLLIGRIIAGLFYLHTGINNLTCPSEKARTIPHPWPWSLKALSKSAAQDTTLPETVL
jgi:hypothetical protein